MLVKVIYIILIILAVSAVAIADVFLKKASSSTFSAALKSPWMIAAVVMYLFQIIMFTYVFVSGAQLSYVGIMQTALYALIVLSAGFFLFQEHFTTKQLIGAIVALIGVIILNLP